jgi:hypothetical protein
VYALYIYGPCLLTSILILSPPYASLFLFDFPTNILYTLFIFPMLWNLHCSNTSKRFICKTRLELSHFMAAAIILCVASLPPPSNLCTCRSRLLPVMSLICDTQVFAVLDYVTNTSLYFYWDCRRFVFGEFEGETSKDWPKTCLCVSDGLSPRLPACYSWRTLNGIFRTYVMILESFSKCVDMFQIWLKCDKKRTLTRISDCSSNITSYISVH